MDAVLVICSSSWVFVMTMCLAACRAAASGDGVWSAAAD
jgi:hypothetical protein